MFIPFHGVEAPLEGEATWLTFYDAGRHVVDRVKFDGKPLVVERAANPAYQGGSRGL